MDCVRYNSHNGPLFFMINPLFLPVEFADQARDALNHLYDSVHLQSHPLTTMLVDPAFGAAQRSKEMRRVLLNAIRSLRPAHGVPAQSADWRAYRILELRYIEGLPPREVMEAVALGKSQYYREQARAVDAVSAILWETWQAHAVDDQPGADISASDVSPPNRALREQWAQQEVEQLLAGASREEIAIRPLLADLQSVIRSLASAKQVNVSFDLAHDFTVAEGDRALLRQTILNVVTYGMDVTSADGQHRGCVTVRNFIEEFFVGVEIMALLPGTSPPATQSGDSAGRQGVGLEICAQLMQTMGGALCVDENPAIDGAERYWRARLEWPQRATPTLLIIDDNEAFIALFRRYVTSTDWHVTGATNGTTARQLAAELTPHVIVLDVMMPQEDGWELLRALKSNPHTASIPVLICSILNEPQLAITLGAAGYLPKPVSQTALLRALAPWHPNSANQAPAH